MSKVFANVGYILRLIIKSPSRPHISYLALIHSKPQRILNWDVFPSIHYGCRRLSDGFSQTMISRGARPTARKNIAIRIFVQAVGVDVN